MGLTSHSFTSTIRPFPYLLPSDILGCSVGIASSQTMNVNVLSSPTIRNFRTQPAQTSTASMEISFMPSINLPNVTRHHSLSLSLFVVGFQYAPTSYNTLGAMPSAIGPSGVGGQQPPPFWGHQ